MTLAGTETVIGVNLGLGPRQGQGLAPLAPPPLAPAPAPVYVYVVGIIKQHDNMTASPSIQLTPFNTLSETFFNITINIPLPPSVTSLSHIAFTFQPLTYSPSCTTHTHPLLTLSPPPPPPISPYTDMSPRLLQKRGWLLVEEVEAVEEGAEAGGEGWGQG